MPSTFYELYNGSLNEAFIIRAREQQAQGLDGMDCAQAYAEQGKPDFALAHLLLTEAPEDVKREVLAHAYDRRATLTDERAESFAQQFHRPFPLVKLEAQKDRLSAQQVRQGRRIRRGAKSISMN